MERYTADLQDGAQLDNEQQRASLNNDPSPK